MENGQISLELLLNELLTKSMYLVVVVQSIPIGPISIKNCDWHMSIGAFHSPLKKNKPPPSPQLVLSSLQSARDQPVCSIASPPFNVQPMHVIGIGLI